MFWLKADPGPQGQSTGQSDLVSRDAVMREPTHQLSRLRRSLADWNSRLCRRILACR